LKTSRSGFLRFTQFEDFLLLPIWHLMARTLNTHGRTRNPSMRQSIIDFHYGRALNPAMEEA